MNATEFTTKVQNASPFHTLRGTIDNVLSSTTCAKLTNTLLSASDFISGSGYETKDNNLPNTYKAHESYSGLDVASLSKLLPSSEDYDWFVTLREHVRKTTEEALGLCPDTLFVHYTQIAQKVEGGLHHPHADNCFHTFVPATTTTSSFEDDDDESDSSYMMAKCDATKAHPYPSRVAASILYLNSQQSGNYDGGEFYWADMFSNGGGEPSVIVTPKEGRMAFFTAGVENLHGALPVERRVRDEEPRRLALAMWYVTDEQLEEVIPPFVGRPERDDNEEEEEDVIIDTPSQKLLMKIPIQSMKTGALKLSLWFHLVKQQSNPTKKSWQANEGVDENMLTMLYRDHSALFSITLQKNVITIHRHVDVHVRPASLQYQLQESVMLHDLLDELVKLAFGKLEDGDGGGGGKEEDRLLVLRDKDVIEEARKVLPAQRSGR